MLMRNMRRNPVYLARLHQRIHNIEFDQTYKQPLRVSAFFAPSKSPAQRMPRAGLDKARR